VIAIVGRELWRGRGMFSCRVVLALMITVTGVWDYALLERTSDWLPVLRVAVLLVAGLAAFAVLFGARFGVVVATTALVGGLLATSAYAVDTASSPHNGAIPTSGPSTGSGVGGGRGGNVSSTALDTLLAQSTTRWAAATTGTQAAGTLELSSGASVMGIGGFSGSDNAPTLAQFEAYVQAGDIHYFIAGAQGGSRRWWRWRGQPDHQLGPEPLQVNDGRRHHGLRPDHRIAPAARRSRPRRRGPRSSRSGCRRRPGPAPPRPPARW